MVPTTRALLLTALFSPILPRSFRTLHTILPIYG
jgi:hypothetical protein